MIRQWFGYCRNCGHNEAVRADGWCDDCLGNTRASDSAPNHIGEVNEMVPTSVELPKPSDLNSLSSDLKPASGEPDHYITDPRYPLTHSGFLPLVRASVAKENEDLRADLAATAVVQQQMGDRMMKLLTLVELQHGALSALVAEVNGECPSLLDEDSGGAAWLDMKVSDTLAAYDRFKGGQ